MRNRARAITGASGVPIDEVDPSRSTTPRPGAHARRAVRLRSSIAGPPELRAITTAHVLGVVADAWVTVALAFSLFFNVSPDSSRPQILLYLGVTMTPLAFLAPLIGPLVDRFRGSQRWVGAVINAARFGCCIGLAASLNDFRFYIWALSLLVTNKAAAASRYALVPGLVNGADELVSANARFSKWSAAVGVIGAPLAIVIERWFGARLLLLGAGFVFLAGAAAMTRVPEAIHLARRQRRKRVRIDLSEHSRAAIAGFPVMLIRCGVGFFSFTMAFSLRRNGEPALVFGGLAVAYAIGSFLGNALAPIVRRRLGEERMISFVLIATIVVCVPAIVTPQLALVFAAAFMIGLCASHARQAFDGILQSSSADAQRARLFAIFETRFQLGYVLGALSATFLYLQLRPAILVVAALYAIGWLRFRKLRRPDPFTVRTTPSV